MTTSHPQADLLRAIADGKQMQIKDYHIAWRDTNSSEALITIIRGDPCRIKPETITVNGVECPKPATKTASHAQWLVEINIGQCYTGQSVNGKTFTFNCLADADVVFHALTKPFKESQK